MRYLCLSFHVHFTTRSLPHFCLYQRIKCIFLCGERSNRVEAHEHH